MSDLEELSDEAEIERRNQQSPKYEWEYVHCNWYQVPVYQEEKENEDG